jgi:tRNA A-37 threonylcarbamoyl transferase component Bud32
MLPTADQPQPTPAPPDEPLPEQIGRYRILERLGAGGMGAVYKAHDPQLDRVVALKLPRFDGPQRDRANRVQRFQREARAAAQVWHPHVCPIYDVGEHDGQPFVVMAYVEGQSLAERLAARGRYEDVGEAVALVRQVLDALDAVHARGIIHRDLKPSNIMIDPAGRAVLTDFGLARPENDAEHLTSDGVVVGTPAYMAPEQAAGESARVGPWTDIYSLAVVLYQMVTGRLPFEGPALTVLAKILHEEPPPPSTLRPGLGPDLQAIIRKAMAKRPPERYQSAHEFAKVLEGVFNAKGSGASSATASPTSALTAAAPGAALPISPSLTAFNKPDSAPGPLGRKRRSRWAVIGCLAAGLVPVSGCPLLLCLLFLRGWPGQAVPSTKQKAVASGPSLRELDPTELFEAAEKGRLVKVQELLRAGIDVNAKDQQGQTALIKAAAKGHAPVVRELLAWNVVGIVISGRKKVAINDQDNKGQTALMMAAENGHADVVQALLDPLYSDHRIELELKDDMGQTALMKAKENGHEDIVQLLEKARAGK